jgi:hypothetical protein
MPTTAFALSLRMAWLRDSNPKLVGYHIAQDRFAMHAVEMILIARYQLAFVIFDISDCAEAVMLEFEDIVGIIEWLEDTLPWIWLLFSRVLEIVIASLPNSGALNSWPAQSTFRPFPLTNNKDLIS